MSMDGRFYKFLALELDQTLNHGKIQKIYQVSKTDFIWVIRTEKKTFQLSISVSTTLPRIHTTEFYTEKPDTPSGFCMFLRKYLEGGTLHSIQNVGEDRITLFTIENINEIGDIVFYHLYMEVFSRYANIILCDDKDIIIDSYKHISPFDEADRIILKGATYLVPLTNKVILSESSIQQFCELFIDPTDKEVLQFFQGFSPLLSKYIIQKFHQGISLNQCLTDVLNQEIKPTKSIQNQKEKFYYFNLFDDSTFTISYPSLCELIDKITLENAKLERMKQISKNVYQLSKREYEKNRNKLEKLTKELENALKSKDYLDSGNQIVAHMTEIHKGDASLITTDFMSDQSIEIPLDRLLTPIENANLYFKRYKKSKNAVHYIEEQIRITKDHIEYFDELITQIENSNISDIDEITEELVKYGFMRSKKKKTKSSTPHFDSYLSSSGNIVFVGKNNLQNDYLTNKKAKSTDYFFHAKEIHGSHVIVKVEANLDEETIRMAANLAAYYSKAKLSSSVPVDYTQIKNIKKIPGVFGSRVIFSTNKTIYIDPNASLIPTYRKNKNGN